MLGVFWRPVGRGPPDPRVPLLAMLLGQSGVRHCPPESGWVQMTQRGSCAGELSLFPVFGLLLGLLGWFVFVGVVVPLGRFPLPPLSCCWQSGQ